HRLYGAPGPRQGRHQHAGDRPVGRLSEIAGVSAHARGDLGAPARGGPEGPSSGGSVRIPVAIQHWIVPVAVLAASECLGQAGLLPCYPTAPTLILAALWEVTSDGELVQALAVSLYRASIGFVLGTGAGVAVGLGAGLVPGVRHFFDPLVSFLYSVPKIAFLP